MSSNNNLKIFAINVNSLINIQRRLNLMEFINTHKPDIILLSETKLSEKHKINFENYDIVRKDRPNSKRSGGTAIIIDTKIKYQHLNTNIENNNSGIEYTTIKIKMLNNHNLIIISIYCTSCNHTITESFFQTEWEAIFQKFDLKNPNNYYIIAGDFNACHTKWGNRTNNIRGTKLNEWMDSNE